MTATAIASLFLGLGLGTLILFFLFRTVMTWYPQINLNRFPFNLIFWLTEPLLIPARKLVPPLGGVDITPILWIGVLSLLRELLLGQQGLLTMFNRVV